MKKIIVIFSLTLLSCSVIYSQSNTEIDKSNWYSDLYNFMRW